MKSEIQCTVKLELTKLEFQDLCRIIDNGRVKIDDTLAELQKWDKQDAAIDNLKRLVEISKLYTNLRAGIR